MASITEKIKSYKQNIKKGNDKENQSLYSEIENELLFISYYFPQFRCDLSETDASDFTLFLKSQLHDIINSFSETSGDFMPYFASVLKYRTRSFYTQKTKKRFSEIAVLNGHASYEYALSEDNTFSGILAEDYSYEEQSLSNMLAYICSRNSMVRRRLLVLLFSIAPEIDRRTLENICTTLKYDYTEMVSLIDFFAAECSETQKEVAGMVQRRNHYYCKALTIELEILAGQDDKDSALKQLEFNKRCQESKNMQIKTKTKTVPYQLLMDVLNLKHGTVASYLYLSRNLLDWCNNLNTTSVFTSADLGISTALMKDAAILKKYKTENFNLNIFHPVEEFKIKLKLHERVE